MNRREQNQVFDELIENEKAIIGTKGVEYAAGADEDNDVDALDNFKSVGALVEMSCVSCGHRQPVGPRVVWAIYTMKHMKSMLSHVAEPFKKLSEPITGRVNDMRVYAGLYACIDKDEQRTMTSPNGIKADSEPSESYLLDPHPASHG